MTRSFLPSPLRSAAATPNELLGPAISVRANVNEPGVREVFRKMLMKLDDLFVTARSVLPSPSKSAAATANGPAPTPMSIAAPTKPPEPSPALTRIDTDPDPELA